MEKFKEFQFGKIIFIFAVPAHIFLVIAFAFRVGSNPISLTSFGIANLVLALVYLLFYGMSTTVDKNRIQISYGLGLIRKNIDVARIDSVSVVSNPWYYGWGIRLIEKGMLYNINGSAGVELTLIDSTRVIRIGSSSPAELMTRIKLEMQNNVTRGK